MSITTFIIEPAHVAKLKVLRPPPPRAIGAPILVPPRSNRYWLIGTAFDYLLRFEIKRRVPLLDSICAEMAAIKRTRRGLSYELGMRLLCLWPPLLRHSLNRKWAFATAVFSNLNAGFDHLALPWRDGRRAAGELVLENGYGIGPIRPETRVCCAVHTYAGRMSICIRCDRKYFDQEKQRAVLDAFLAQLRETVESET